MTNDLWSVDSNWTGGTPAGDSTAALVFPTKAKNLVNTNDLDNLSIQSIRFSANDAYTISGNPLTLNGGGINLTSGVKSVTQTISLNITLGASQTWRTTEAGAVLDIVGVVSGNYHVSKSGAGTLMLDAANTYNGITLNAGVLTAGTDQSLGSGKLTLHGGALEALAPLTLANTFSVTGNSTVGGSNDITFAGAGTLSKGFTLTIADTGTTTLAGKLSGNGALAEAAGTGTLVLAANNSHAGTTLNSGMLVVLTNTALGTGMFTLNGGTLQAGAAVTLANTFTVSGSAALGGSDSLTLSGHGTLGAGNTLSLTNTGTVTLMSNIDGAGGLTMAGPGVLVLGGNNTFTGTTMIATGTVLINGTQASSAVTVSSGATLGGAGVVGAIMAAGLISPGGPGPGLLQSGGALFSSTSALRVKLNGTNAGTDYDQLNVSGIVDLSGSPQLNATVGFASTDGDTFTIIASTAGITGRFNGLPDGATLMADGITLRINYSATSVVLTTVSLPTLPPRGPSTNGREVGSLPVGAVVNSASVREGQAIGRSPEAVPLHSDAGGERPPRFGVIMRLKTVVGLCDSATEDLQPTGMSTGR